MRLIDADYFKNLPFERLIHTDFGDTAIPIEEIDNAPTIEAITNEELNKIYSRLLSECVSKGYLSRVDILKILLGI